MSKEKRYWHTEIGYNYRMTNLQAALGLAQLERIDEILTKKKLIFEWYQQGLAGINSIRLNQQASWAIHVYWMVCLEIDSYNESQRDELMLKLKLQGIDSRPYFYPIASLPMYKSEKMPIADKLSTKGVNLPSYFEITKEEVQFICIQLKEML